jgi:hypothetical protein
VVAWAEPLEAVTARDGVDVEEEVEEEVEVESFEIDPVAGVDVTARAAVVTPVVEPPYVIAASEPNPPTAATLANAVPMVSARSRAIARSRSTELRRVTVVMAEGCDPNLSGG